MEKEEKKTSLNDGSFYKTLKLPLKNIIKNRNIYIPKISKNVIKMNKIAIHSLQLMKIFLLEEYKNNKTLPKINKTLIKCFIKIPCVLVSSKRKLDKLEQKVKDCYDKHFTQIRNWEKLDYKYMNTVIDYLAIDILTMYENNIKMHYVDYIDKYINCYFEKRETVEKIKNSFKDEERKTKLSEFYASLRKVKRDILMTNEEKYSSEPSFHEWIENEKKYVLPNREINEKGVYYDLKCKPQDYLPCMIYMMEQVEKLNNLRKENAKKNNEKIEQKELNKLEYALNNPFPMRNNLVPKHIRIDTITLVHMLYKKEEKKQNNNVNFNKKLNDKNDKVWNFFFKMDKKCFKKNGYKFHHMIETDGISCSILFKRNDLGKFIKKTDKEKQIKEQYISELDNYDELKNKNIVGIDPGKCDLLYCVDNDSPDRNHLRYSQDQRRKETRLGKYNKILRKMKKEKDILKLETSLSFHNKRTMELDKFKDFVNEKNKISILCFDFYEKELNRKMKLRSYVYRMKSEDKLMNRFEKMFGSPENTIICIGDYAQKKHMKYKEPVKGKGFRTTMRKKGYNVYLVDEFRTSKGCSKCENGDCLNFRKVKNPKPYEYETKRELITCHGLLMCKTCMQIWNRDENGSVNIYKIARNIINGLERPKYLQRKKVV